MKPTRIFYALALLIIGCTPQRESNANNQSNQSLAEAPAEAEMAPQSIEEPSKKLRHVVLFKFKEGTTAEQIAEVEAAFGGLPAKIEEIRGFEWGTNNSPEGLDKGFTHCYFLTFNSEEDRDIYLPHPDHAAFGEVVKPHLEDVLVVDYWTE